MPSYDVVVIGAGAAGLTAGALLAAEGKRVVVVDRGPHLGGRALAVPDEGFTVNLGGHLVEDGGSGLTKVFEHVGKELIHGEVSNEMPIWDNAAGAWGSIRDRYADKTELKKVIKALVDTPYEELDKWDDRCLREWIHQHTRDQGVVDLFEFISVLECMTDNWYDHSASDNLYVRKMHFEERNTAAYSFWPGQGWDGMWADLSDALTGHGGELRLNTAVERVVIENAEVKGVAVGREPKILPNEFFEEEILEAPVVISTLPVWHVLNVVPRDELPEWYTAQIDFLAQDKFRIAWLGLYLATEEPVSHYDPRELCTWTATPSTDCSGFMFDQSAMDPSCSPPGTHLHVMGAIVPGAKGRHVAGHAGREPHGRLAHREGGRAVPDAAGAGAMVFTSSIGGLKGIMQVAHYVSAKHGIVGLMRTMANELAPHHIRVNTVHPTNVDTHMIQNPGTWGMFAPDDPEPTREKAMPGFLSLNALPVPWVEPIDIANAVLFLASDEARYITRVALPVDAGAAVR